MDIFIEHLITKKKTKKGYLAIALTVLLGVFLIILVLNVPAIIGNVPIAFPIIIIGVGVGVYYIITSKNIEYEYAVTNGELDIDRIVSQRKRKRIFSAHCKDFEILAPSTSDKYSPEIRSIQKQLECVSQMTSKAVYFAVLKYNGEKTVVFFEPTEKMMNAFKVYIPKKIFM